ncbi:MAG: NAD(P)/FAD-dependent oxidoreductase [Chloroflexi bacterium]|nr:NAD(P)/FAD-dependent oxidoreductase [Chloroflexota bacterium]MYD48054.1 NAD(P)/FAD-dependent oxidoreductase [Chloroflexota bacterium]
MTNAAALTTHPAPPCCERFNHLPMPDLPIIVIGGGPAGSCVSALLARQGHPVVLLERERFPRAHVGESLLPASIPILDGLGVLDEVNQAGFTVKAGATMIWGVDRQPWGWHFSETNASNPTSYQVWRPEFDAILLNNARRLGVDVREGWQATGVMFDDDGTAIAVRCRPTDSSGGTRELPARYVVDASGQGGLLSRQLGLRQWDDFFRNLAVYGYYQGGERLPAPDQGNILIESQPDGWLWHIPLRDGWASVGAVVDAETGQRGIRELGPQRFLESQIAAAPQLADMLASARFVSGPEVLRDWSYRCQSLHGPGYILVGDAGCFIDPLFSSGVHLALTSATLAAAAVASALEDPTIAGPAGQVYQQLYYKEYGHFRELARLFYSSNRTADSYFWEARRLLDDDPSLTPRQSFIQAVAGQPPRGYERAVLSHGHAPAAFGASVAAVESERQRRQEQGLPPDVPLHLAEGVRLQRQPVLADNRFVWGVGLVTDGHPEGLPCSALVAQLLTRLNGRRTTIDAIADLCNGMDAATIRQVEPAARQALQILYVDGAITTA